MQQSLDFLVVLTHNLTMDNILAAPQKNKTTWKQLVVYSIKLLLGLVLGIIFSVIGQEIISYGKFATTFVVLTFVGLTLRVTRGWSLAKVLILVINVALFFIFIKTYILVAPGE